MKEREEIIHKIFEAWVIKDIALAEGILNESAIYKDHFGDEVYKGRESIAERFKEFYKNHDLMEHGFEQIMHQDAKMVVDWSCTYSCHGNVISRHKMSVVEFDENNKILSIKEYVSIANK